MKSHVVEAITGEALTVMHVCGSAIKPNLGPNILTGPQHWAPRP